jgi:ATP-dependent Clp protease ATP-binding subunit ClpA
MRRGRTGIRNPKRPMGSFLFLGPTGVGKTETAKALAAVFFGREDALLRLDMSEYQSADALSRLIGSFESGQPGVLANLLRQNPYGVLLLDEFEKTNREVLNLFLQILDDGRLTDGRGRVVNFTNTIIILTSNLGSELFTEGQKKEEREKAALDAVKKFFRPEFINRLDSMVIFNPLDQEMIGKIVDKELSAVADRLKKQNLDFEATEALKKHYRTRRCRCKHCCPRN